MAMSGYTKLFSSIIHSTIWRAPDHVRIIWVTMLAMSDKRGLVEASVPGLADAARVTIDNCHDALAALESPDPESRSQECDGRRIERVDGGWLIVNYTKYRTNMAEADKREKTRKRVERWRARKRGVTRSVTPVTKSNDCNYKADPDPDPDPKKKNTCQVSSDVKRVFEAWKADTGHSQAKLDVKRARRIKARLAEGYSADELITAIAHRRNDPWLMGKGDAPRVYDGLETLLRDASQVERLRDLTEPLPVKSNGKPESEYNRKLREEREAFEARERRADARRRREWMSDAD